MSDTATTETADIVQTIEAILASIRPAVRADGGDIELVDYDASSGRVRLRMVGACYACPLSMATLRAGIEQRLRQVAPEVQSVVAI
jgi:Fe-S cluster biogenesis protein NfuA